MDNEDEEEAVNSVDDEVPLAAAGLSSNFNGTKPGQRGRK